MMLSKDNTDAHHTIDAYSSDGVSINKMIHKKSLVLTPEQLITDWKPQDIHQLRIEDLETLTRLAPEIILLGTGDTLIFPQTSLQAFILQKGIRFEVMTNHRACQTFMALAAEHRKVVLGLLMMDKST